MYRGMLTWVKPSLGLGNYFRGTTEHVLFGIRGKLKLRCTDIALPTCSTGADEVPARDQS
jgi:N6-adenosine-specific RNA methylase IME4